MKVIDIETKSIHNVIKIDFDTSEVVMENKQYGYTRQGLDKVVFLREDSDPLFLEVRNKS